MKAFVNTPITKDEFFKELKWHQEQDRFLQGTYSREDNGQFKGCAVGCSINSIACKLQIDLDFQDHGLYEKYLGIPEWLARVQDTIFEGLEEDRSKLWPVEFTEAINVGADLNQVRPDFIVYVLESNLERIRDDEFKEQRDAVQGCIDLWKRKDLYSKAWLVARSTARLAAESAGRSTESSVYSVVYSAVRSAGSSADSIEWSLRLVADSIARSLRLAAFEKFADKLLELIRNCR